MFKNGIENMGTTTQTTKAKIKKIKIIIPVDTTTDTETQYNTLHSYWPIYRDVFRLNIWALGQNILI